MSDLISRQALQDKLKDLSDMYTLEEEARVVLEAIVKIVTEQPTAYDVLRVVAELEKLKNTGSVTKTEMLITKACVNKAIEIARKGGVE